MAQKNIPNMIIRQLANPKNWAKKKMVALGVAVATALVANQFQNKNTTTTSQKGKIYTAKVIKVADGKQRCINQIN